MTRNQVVFGDGKQKSKVISYLPKMIRKLRTFQLQNALECSCIYDSLIIYLPLVIRLKQEKLIKKQLQTKLSKNFKTIFLYF